MALGAIDAIKAAGKVPGKDIIIVGCDSVKAVFYVIVAGFENFFNSAFSITNKGVICLERKNILEMKGITIQFPGAKVLYGINFSLRAGEINSMLGENGAGKSTLIKCLTGAKFTAELPN